METPLDVLSRAASLVQPDTKENTEPEASEDSPKVMLSAENRRKRNLERREIAQVLNFDDGRLEKLSSVKTAGTQTSPLNPVPTTKSRIDSGPPPLISIVPKSEESSYLHSHLPVQTRPSVITPTNIMRRPVSFMATPHLYGPSDMFSYPGPHRREIVESGMIDPFVEEHFRRSLGEDYKCVSPTSMSAAGSVDDHFAKALGDTWQKLKKSDVSNKPSNATQLHSIVSPAN
ncbi:PREDICTED: transcription cofactor vestigial-like protein 4 [Acropora digitifera]|uniref:transcription cofactor vestigial-like protein 4 n=1 Tax=Acropora digitifera TaxID=70779 RepID=UPI00077ACF60|nr:PREDICTED: transcription cofactor vestigial-like protein 4 [Acropora digitifera]